MNKNVRNYNLFAQAIQRFAMVMCFFTSALATIAASYVPVQTFYIPIPEDHLLQSLVTIAGGQTGTYAPVDPIHSYVSIAIFADNTRIYFDQREGGYDLDIANSQNLYNAGNNPGGSQIWGDGDLSNGVAPGFPSDILNAGDVILLESEVVSTTRDTVIDFDGGDKFAPTKPVAVSRALWAAGSVTMFAGANEVYDTAFWGTDFKSPIGVNIPDATDYQIFEYTGLSIMAGVGGATVQVDADANGTYESQYVLTEGQACLINGGVSVGGRVLSDKPVQVDLITGDIYSFYESRFIRLLPTAYWSSSQTTPVATPATVTVGSTSQTSGTTVWLYNPELTSLDILYIRRSTGNLITNTLTVAGGSAGGYLKQTLESTSSGARFISKNGKPFYALTAVDSTGTTLSTSLNSSDSNQTWDWGFALVPESSLTPQVLVGLGIGRDPTSSTNPNENASPVWVTPIGNGESNVTVYVDYDADPDTGAYTDPNNNKYDISYTAKELDRLKIYNPSGNQSGMLIYVIDPKVKLAAAWGADPALATTSSPGLDFGTGIPPFPLFVARKRSVLVIDADNDGFVSPGDTLRYSIVIENTGRQPVTGLTVKDTLPPGITYTPNKTFFINANSVTNAIVDNGIPAYQTIFPLDEGGINLPEPFLPVRSSWEVLYTVVVDPYESLPDGLLSLQNTATVGGVGLTTSNIVINLIYGRVGHYVWWDQNEDGLQDVGEPGLNGVTVSLLSTNGTPVLNSNGFPITMVTSNDAQNVAGYYRFTGIAADDYIIAFSSPAGFQPTSVNSDGLGVTGDLNSDVNPLTGRTGTFTLTGGKVLYGVDAGFIEKSGSIAGAVRLDVNGNGVVDAADTQGIAGVTVQLLNANSQVVAVATTSATGAYLFADVRPGTYTIVQQLPSGYANTYDIVGANDLRIPRTISSGQNSTGNNFYDTLTGAASVTKNKVLYLSDPSQALDRIDPVATADTTTATTALLSSLSLDNQTSSIGRETTFTFSHTTGTGANRLLLVGISKETGNAAVSSVTYGGSALTWVGTQNNGNNTRMEIWRLVNPPIGANNVLVTLSNRDRAVIGAATFTGVNQTTPLGSFVSATGSSTAPSVTVSSTAGELVFDTLSSDSSNTASPGTGQAQLWQGANRVTGGGSIEPGAASVVMSWTAGNASWAIGAVPIKPAISEVVFTQSPAFQLPFSLAAGATVQITNFVEVLSGTMPANPAITAKLSAGGSTFLTLNNPTFYAATSRLVWSGTLPSTLNIAVGQAVTLSVSSVQSGVDFRIRYDSATYPSKIILPTASIIAVPSVGIYNAAYPGGLPVTNVLATTPLYVRMTVTDPFGAADITRVGLTLDGPGTSGDVSLMMSNAYVVASNGWSKTYEYPWATTTTSGNYAITATAHEGSEGIIATATNKVTLIALDARVGDFVWVDTNGNGRQDMGEPGLAGVAVYLHNALGSVIASTNTTASGAYLFTGLTAGNYSVSFAPPAGYLFTTNAVGDEAGDSNPLTGTNRTATVALTVGSPNVTVDAGFYQPATLAGFVRADANGNGIAEPADTNGIAGVTVQLLNAASNVVATAVTAANGSYSFTNLAPGSYTVREIDLGSWYSTLDISGPNDNLIPVTLTSGQSSVGNNFYDARRAAIGDFVWVDSNGNGQQDSGELGLSNVVVRLYDTNSVIMATVTSTVAGAYAFTNLMVGTYTVGFTPPANYLFTTSNVGNTATDSNPLTGTNRTALITLTNGQSDNTVDAGFIPGASVAGFVRVDINGNGITEAVDTNGIAGVTVQLLNAASNVVATAVTAANGSYSFTNLAPGSYTVRETDLGGWYSTTDIVGPNDNLIPVTLAIGQNSTGNNFHDTQRATLGDFVWVDTNGNGQQDGGELGLAGVVLRLYGPNDVVLATATSTASGAYAFTNLVVGTYTVGFAPPAGYFFTTSNTGNDATDSDPLAGTNRTAAVTLTSGQTESTVDAGFYQLASIAGSVFVDVNGNGVPEAADTTGIAGVTVLLLNAASNTVAVATTSNTGAYLFSNVVPRSYTVVQVLPGGYSNTYDVVGANDLRVALSVASGQALTGRNFYDTLTGAAAVTQNKVLYLSDPSQALDRIDPVAANDTTTATAVLTGGSSGFETVVAAATTSAQGSGDVSSLTFSHTVGSGANRLLLVAVSLGRDSATFGSLPSINSVTYGGSAMTLVTSAIGQGRFFVTYDNSLSAIYRLVNPPVGTANVVVSLSSIGAIAAGATSFTGVDQTTPLGTSVSAANAAGSTGASSTVTVSSGSGQLIFGSTAFGTDVAITAGSGQSSHWSQSVSNPSGRDAGAASTQAGATSVTHSYAASAASTWAITAVPIRPATSTTIGGSVTFTQAPAFTLPFSLASGTTIRVTNYVNVTSGTMPANPSVTARLSAGGATFLTMSNPSYSNGTLVWSGTLGSAVNIAAGQAVSLSVSNAQSGVAFQIRYDSATYPSKIILPTASIIAVPSLAVYDAPYPGGVPVTNSLIASLRYVRVRVTDPFGAADITSTGLIIDGPGTSGDISTTFGAGQVVASDAWSKTYEYAWQTLALSGSYSLTVTAHEGTEGITATANTTATLYGAAVGDFVWYDVNGDGVQDSGEAGIAGVRVYVDSNGNGSYNAGEPFATTAADGSYMIGSLTAGTLTVRVDTATLPGGLAQTYDLNGGLDSAASVTLASAQTLTDVDFGYRGTGSIGDRIFADYNNNGIWDAGEGLVGVDVTVTGDMDGDGISESITVTTTADGYYLAADLLASAAGVSYTVAVDTADLPAGLTINSVDPDGGGNSSTVVTLTTALSNRLDQDFGYRSPALYTISGQVRDDYDSNGAFSDPDLPVGGVLIQLYSDPNGDGNPSDGVVLKSTRTLANGTYLFTDLIAGNYVVREIDPVYSVSTADTVAANDNLIPVAIVNSSSSGNNFLDAVDPAGYFYAVADGRIVPGGLVVVSGPGADVLMDGSSGQYMFISTNSVETTFTIAVTPPPGYIIDPTRPAQPGAFDPTGGSNPTVLGSYENPSNPGYLVNYSAESNTFYYVFTLAPGDPPVINNNFPLIKYIEITGTVFKDTNRLTDNTVNGTGTDAGGLYANLVDPTTQTVIASKRVNPNGTYSFSTTNGVAQNTSYDVILTRTNQIIAATLDSATLPTGWISTGEHVGAGAGDDGTVDSILSVATTSEGVTEANLGIDQVPDITPIITAVPNVMHAVQNFYITVQVAELLSIDTEGLITVRIPIDPRWILNGAYAPELTILGATALNNDDWAYSKDATHHIFKSSVVIPAGASSYFGFNATWDAGLTQGFYTITSQIDSNSGGENRIDNNVDAEKLDYFIQ